MHSRGSSLLRWLVLCWALLTPLLSSYRASSSFHVALKNRDSNPSVTRVHANENVDTTSPGPDSDIEPSSILKRTEASAATFISSIPVYRSIAALYSFFYWFPRKNLPYDHPWVLFKNSTTEFFQWYQLPHNLPPYRYLGQDHPEDFFCWGLPGNTLPLGDWDPAGLQQVTPKVVKKYRESELKHGRIAMLACVGFITQENFHPLHEQIGGLAITHMQQLRDQLDGGIVIRTAALLSRVENIDEVSVGIPLDYCSLVGSFAVTEAVLLKRLWKRWDRAHYRHQFDHNIGIGNLREDYSNGDYGFDPLRLMPKNKADRRFIIEAELNHCRLAMVASIGLIIQEYLTGLPALTAAADWLHLASSTSGQTSGLGPLEAISSAAEAVLDFVRFTFSRLSGAFEEPLL